MSKRDVIFCFSIGFPNSERHPQRQQSLFGPPKFGLCLHEIVFRLFKILQRQGFGLIEILGQFIRANGKLRSDSSLINSEYALRNVRAVDNQQDFAGLHAIAQIAHAPQ